MIHLDIPGSKSWINRFLVMASFANKPSSLEGWNSCDDCQLMVDALRSFGMEINQQNDSVEIIPGQWHSAEIDAGDAGTVARFLTPIAAWLGNSQIHLSSHLSTRPFDEGLMAVREAGGEVTCDGQTLKFGQPMSAKSFKVCAKQTTQFLSGFRLLAAGIQGSVQVQGELVNEAYPQLTQHIIRLFQVKQFQDKELFEFSQSPQGVKTQAEIDLSGACALLVALLLSSKEGLLVGWSATTAQPENLLPKILINAGINLELTQEGLAVHGGQLESLDFNTVEVPDVVPYLAPLALVGKQRSIFRNVDYISSKESDRLQGLLNFAEQAQVKFIHEGKDLIVEPGLPQACTLDGTGDHRMVMAAFLFKVLNPKIQVKGLDSLNKSFPKFDKKIDQILNT